MKEIPVIPSMRPEPKRDQWGRYVLPGPDGVERTWTRATTTAGALDDLYPLMEWKRRMVLQGVATNPILLADVPYLTRELTGAANWRDQKSAKEALNEIAERAHDAAGGNDGSKLGTLLHTITEYADAGRLGEIESQIPPELLDDLAAYLTTMRDAGIECPPEYIERILVTPEVDSAGTTDRILVMPEPCDICGLTLRIGDLKTQKSVDFGFLKIAIQLAEYAYAEGMITADGTLGPMPRDLCRCRGIVMHLPVGQGVCTLYEVDLVEGWEAARVAHYVRVLRGRSKGMGQKYEYTSRTAANIRRAGDASRAPSLGQVAIAATDTDDAQLRHLVSTAGHVKALEALYLEASAAGTWTPALTTLAKLRKAALLQETTDAQR